LPPGELSSGPEHAEIKEYRSSEKQNQNQQANPLREVKGLASPDVSPESTFVFDRIGEDYISLSRINITQSVVLGVLTHLGKNN
jgi:hypothetical protein